MDGMEIVNPSTESWRPEDGWAASYLLFDEPTGSGFEVVRPETGEFLNGPHPELAWVIQLLERHRLRQNYRGDGIYK